MLNTLQDTQVTVTMADVNMTDAPPKAKTSKAEADAGGKKRFEVKKVCATAHFLLVV